MNNARIADTAMFLTRDELADLTGYERQQQKWFDSNGVPK